MRSFEKGHRVVINRGDSPFRDQHGVVESMDKETGKVEILFDGNDVPVFMANGNVMWEDRVKANAQAVPSGNPKLSVEAIEAVVGSATEVKPGPITSTGTTRECICGCGGEISKKAKGFLPGHDQRHKGNLIRIMQEGGENADFAESELRRLSWRTNAEIVELKAKARPKAVSITA